MKSVKESILDRRSVRRYERDTISEEQMALIYEAIRNTPTSYNAKNLDMPDFTSTVDGVIVGVVDATLAMMNAVTMAESLGLGSCPIGYARTAAPEALASLMKLPEKTFVVCGLAIGVPREHPDLKPKQPESLVIHKGYYRSDRDAMTDELLAYDAEVGEYNRTREGTKSDNDWASHIVDYYREAMNYRMLRALQRRGFDVAK